MTKRTPEAVIGAEDYLLVKHTHDVEQARALMVLALIEDNGCPAWDPVPRVIKHYCDPGCIEFATGWWKKRLSNPVQVYMRIIRALPNSESAAIGWAYSFREEPGPARGAFKAVVFR